MGRCTLVNASENIIWKLGLDAAIIKEAFQTKVSYLYLEGR